MSSPKIWTHKGSFLLAAVGSAVSSILLFGAFTAGRTFFNGS